MQPMPAKTRTAVAVGAAVLAVVIGSVALWSSRNGAETLPPDLDEMSIIGEAATPPPVTTEGAFTQPEPLEPIPTVSPVIETIPAIHLVEPGDTLSQISRKYYGTNIYAGDIEVANALSDPDHLEVGQQLRLPTLEELQGGGN